MKPSNLILIFTMLIFVLSGCKKDDKDPEPVNEFANVFLVEKIVTWDDNIYPPAHYYYTYDSAGRITASDELKFYYNPDGTLHKIIQTWGDSIVYKYNNAKQLSQLIVDDYPVDVDTVDLFYTNGEKPDHSYGSNFGLTHQFSYGQHGMVDTIKYLYEDFMLVCAYGWQNGNLQKIEATSPSDSLYYNTDVYEFDTKPNYAATMHLSKEFLLSVELTYSLSNVIELLSKNNVTKQTFYDEYHDITNVYWNTITEYNNQGLPTKIDQDYKTVELIYETR